MAALTTAIIIGTSVLASGFIGGALTKTNPTQTSKPSQRRTREDYLGTSFDLDVNLKHNNLPPTTIKPITPIQPISVPNPIQPVTPIQLPQPLTPSSYMPQEVAGYNNNPTYNYYTDPYQVNSLADVVLNREGKNLVLEDLGMSWATNIPILQEIIVGLDLLKRDTIDPISKGSWGEAGMNWLMGSAETLDVVANPVKGLFLEGGQGFVRGLGVGSEGRTNYAFDVNSGVNLPDWIPLLGGADVADLALEIAVDPLNFLSFGSKQVASTSIKSVTASVMDDVAKELVQSGVKNVDELVPQVSKIYNNAITEQAIKNSDESMQTFVSTLKYSGLSQEAIQRILQTSTDLLSESTTHNIIKGSAALYNITDTVDNTLLNLTPIGWTFGLTRWVANRPVIKTYGNALKTRFFKTLDSTAIKRTVNKTEVTYPSLQNLNEDLAVKESYSSLEDSLDADRIIRQPLNIDGMPSEKELVSKYQKFEIYKSDKTIDDFIESLYNNNDIDAQLYSILKDKTSAQYLQFSDYYNDMVKPIGDTFVKLTSDVKLQFKTLTKEVDAVLNKSANKLDALVNASRYLDDIYHGVFNLNQISSIDTYIAKANKRLAALNNIKGSAKPLTDILEAQATLNKLMEVKKLRTHLEAQLGIKITEFGDFNYIQDFINAEDPVKFVETRIALNEQQLKTNFSFDAIKMAKKFDRPNMLDMRSNIVKDLKELTTLRKLVNDVDKVNLKVNVTQKTIQSNVDKVRSRVVKDLEFIDKHLKDLKIPNDVTDSLKQNSIEIKSIINNYITEYGNIFDQLYASDVVAAAKISDLITELMEFEVKTSNDALLYATILADLTDTIYFVKEFFPTKLDDVHSFLNSLVNYASPDIQHLYRFALEDVALTDSTRIYTMKNNAYVILTDLLESYNNNITMREFIDDMALDTDESLIAKLFKIFMDMDDAISKTSVDLKAQAEFLYNSANAHHNYEVLFSTVNSLDVADERNVIDAFMDWLAGSNYQNLDTFKNSLSDYDGNLDPIKVRENLNRLVNGKALSGINKNTTLYQVLELGKPDKTKAHTALYDADITAQNYYKLMQEQGKTLPEGYEFIAFDTETTGYNVKAGHQLTNIGATHYIVKDNKLVALDSFDDYARLNPDTSMSQQIADLTGIEQQVAEATMTQQQLINKFNDWYSQFNITQDVGYKRLPIVGHNSNAFDLPFIKAADVSRNKITFGESIDVLDLAKDYAGYTPVSDELTEQLTSILGTYLRTQKEYSAQVIQLLDKTAFNYMFESMRHFEDIVLNRYRSLDSATYQLLNDEVVLPILGRIRGIDGTNATREYTTESGGELLHRTETMEVTSFVRDLREELASLKMNNRVYQTKYFNLDDINQDVAKHLGVDSINTNVVSYFNGRMANGDFVNKYVLNQYTPKTIFRDKSGGLLKYDSLKGIDPYKVTKISRNIDRNLQYSPAFKPIDVETKTDLVNMLNLTYENTDIWKLVDNPSQRTLGELYAIHRTLGYRNAAGEAMYGFVDPMLLDSLDETFSSYKIKTVNEELLDTEKLITYMNILNDDYASPIFKREASDYIAANGSNIDQLERLVAAASDIEDYVKDNMTITERMNRVVGIIKNSNMEYYQDGVRMAKAIANVDNTVTKSLENKIAIAETETIFGDNPLSTIAFIEDAKAPIIMTQQWRDKSYADRIQRIIDNEDLFNAYGVDVKYDDNYFALVRRADYIRPDIDIKSDYKIHANTGQGTVNELLQSHNGLFNVYDKYKHSITGPANTAVTNIDAATYRSIFETIPDFITEHSVLKNEEFYKNMFIKDKVPVLSYTNIGDLSSRKFASPSYQAPFNNTITLIETQMRKTDGASKLMQLYFNKDVDINSPVWRDLSDEDLIQLFKDNKYLTAVYLTSSKGKPNVKRMIPVNADNVKFLKETGATIVPKDMANSLSNTVNVVDFKDLPLGLDKVAEFWHKYIIGTYKTIYVSSPGLVFRNMNDILIKNLIGGTIADIPADLKSFVKAFQDWKQYDEVVKAIYKDYDGLTRQTLNSYLATHPEINRAWFDEMHEYATSNVTAGLAQAQQDALRQYAELGSDKTKLQQLYNDLMLENNILWKNDIMNINTQIEHAGRLSKLRIDRANGMNAYAAYGNVLDTHFDYRTKGKGTLYAETLFPFVTFPLYNLQFWLDSLTKSPWIVRNLTQLSTDSLDIQEKTQFYIDNSLKFQSIMTGGNILLGDTIWKTNPSLYDAYNLITNPADQLKQRLAAPLKLLGDQALLATGNDKWFNPDPDYVSDYVTNLDKIGLGDLEKSLNKYGLYTFTRLGNNILKGVSLLDTEGALGLDGTDSLADIIPSITTEHRPNYGTNLGETFSSRKLQVSGGSLYQTVQDKTGVVTKSTFYPNKYPDTSYTSGRSYNRIPYVRRYYNPSYNFYNRWKAERASTYATQVPPTVESLQYTFKGLLYDTGMSSKMLKAYGRKQGQVYKV